jgi:zinc transporter 2
VLAEGITDADKQRRSEQTQRKLLFALAIAFLFMLVEVTGGIWAHSLAIITDAAHLLSDVSGFAVSAAAAYYSTKPSHSHFSYGYHRIEVLGALASVLTVWLVTGILLWEAIARIRNPEPVDGKIMTIIAMIGVAVNIALMAILGGHGHSHHGGGGNSGHTHGTTTTDLRVTDHHAEESLLNDGDHHQHNHDDHSDDDDHKDHASFSSNINIRGAVIHVIGDLVQSIGVVIAGGLIWYHQDDPRWALADPICTFFFAALVLFTTFSLLNEIGNILMERAPHGADVEQAYNDLLAIEGVENIDDFHIWSLTPGIPLLCAHIATTHIAEPAEVLRRVTLYCRKELGIEHTTIQMEVTRADIESRHESEATLVAAV